MDELELVRTARDDLSPTDAIAGRHRAALLRATASRPGRARRPVLAAAAVVTLLVGLAAAVAYAARDTDRILVADTATTTPTPVPTTEGLACSGDLPGDVRLPVGATGPHAGPAAGGRPAEAGQLVRHWVRLDETIEVRWPADAEPDLIGDVRDRQVGDSGGGTILSIAAKPHGEGRFLGMLLAVKDTTAVRCDRVTIEVVGNTAAAVDELMAGIEEEFFVGERAPLVVAEAEIDEVPAADGCQAPPGTVIPNVGGPLDRPRGSTPVGTFQAFLDQHPTLAQGGYTAGALPDGSIAYYWESSPGFVPTVVHVAPVGDEWAVIAWDAAGC